MSEIGSHARRDKNKFFVECDNSQIPADIGAGFKVIVDAASPVFESEFFERSDECYTLLESHSATWSVSAVTI